MKRGSPSFTLIEVMLAVAVFAIAVLGSARALNEMIGIHVELLRTAMRRQAVESCAARILATTNNPQSTGRKGQPIGDEGTISLWAVVTQTNSILLPVPNNSAATRRLSGWCQVEIQARTKKEEPLESISFLMWPQR
jgi:prepilin-type N-terminal cleavage/methylation domain-containing protein